MTFRFVIKVSIINFVDHIFLFEYSIECKDNSFSLNRNDLNQTSIIIGLNRVVIRPFFDMCMKDYTRLHRCQTATLIEVVLPDFVFPKGFFVTRGL